MSNITEFSAFHHPVGSFAIHKSYGLVSIFSVDGHHRGVTYDYYQAVGVDEHTNQVLYAEDIEIREAVVHVKDLSEANLNKDIALAIKRGELKTYELGAAFPKF